MIFRNVFGIREWFASVAADRYQDITSIQA
jgi:hypothetical protein